MKRMILIVAILIMAAAGTSFAVNANTSVYQSSYVAVTGTNQYITGSIHFGGVIVSSASAGGWLKLYDSTWTAENQIGAIDLGTLNYYPFEIWLNKGLTYTSNGIAGAAGVLIKYTTE